jgi:tetratricopeptide (TPR) repeat protein
MSFEVGDLRAQANATCELANWFESEGYRAQARDWCERYLGVSRQAGSRLGEAYALGNLASIAIDDGRPAEGMRLLESIGRTHRELVNSYGEAITLLTRGCADTLIGRSESAIRDLDEALKICEAIGLRRWEARVRAARSRLHDAVGRLDEALADAGSALRYWSETGVAREEAEAFVDIGGIEARKGDVPAARRCLDRAGDLSRTMNAPGLALRLAVARAAILNEDPALAVSLLADGEPRLSHSDRMGVRFLLWCATGDRDHLLAAKRLLIDMVEHSPEDCRESMLANVRLHREIAAAAGEAGL